MVVVHPTIYADEAAPHGGHMVVSFPPGSGCPSFTVPLIPDEELLKTWKLYVCIFALTVPVPTDRQNEEFLMCNSGQTTLTHTYVNLSSPKQTPL